MPGISILKPKAQNQQDARVEAGLIPWAKCFSNRLLCYQMSLPPGQLFLKPQRHTSFCFPYCNCLSEQIKILEPYPFEIFLKTGNFHSDGMSPRFQFFSNFMFTNFVCSSVLRNQESFLFCECRCVFFFGQCMAKYQTLIGQARHQ